MTTFTRLSAAMILLLASALPARAEARNKDADAATQDETAVRVVLQSVQASMNMMFGEDGGVQHESQSGMMSFYAYPPAGWEIVKSQVTELTFITEGGESVSPILNSHSMMSSNERDRKYLLLRASFDMLPPPRLYARVTGKAELTVAEGNIAVARLGPWSEIRSKRIRIAEHPQARVMVTQEGDYVQVKFNHLKGELIHEIKFLDGQGKELSARPYGSTAGSHYHANRYQVSLPEDGQVRLSLRPGLRVVEIPFELTDFRMPALQGQTDQFDLTFHAEPSQPAPLAARTDPALHTTVEGEEPVQ